MNRNIKIVAIGELLWDCFPEGRQLGGAPTNVAFHCRQFGAEAALVSAMGNDEPGQAAHTLLTEMKIATNGVQLSSYPTGQVEVLIDCHGQPTYHIRDDVAWDHIAFSPVLEELATSADAVCFGTLAQRSPVSRRTILQFVARCDKSCLKVFDINLRQDYFTWDTIETSLQLADVLKLNDQELPILTRENGLSGDWVEQLKALLKRYELTVIALTRGGDGAIMVTEDTVSVCPGIPVNEMVDTVGAGDSFTAVMITGLLKHRPLDDINRQACRTASFVCTQHGATPCLPSGLTSVL